MTEVLSIVLLPSVLVFQENALYISSGCWIIQDLLYLYRDTIFKT